MSDAGTVANLGGSDKRPRVAEMHNRAIVLAELYPMFLLKAVEGRGGVRRQRPQAFLPGRGEQRPQLRAVQERRLAADRHKLVEDQDKGGCDQANAHRAKRGTADAVA